MPKKITKVSFKSSATPPGLSFNETNGTFSGKPTSNGTYTTKVTAKTNYGEISKNITFIIKDPNLNPIGERYRISTEKENYKFYYRRLLRNPWTEKVGAFMNVKGNKKLVMYPNIGHEPKKKNTYSLDASSNFTTGTVYNGNNNFYWWILHSAYDKPWHHTSSYSGSSSSIGSTNIYSSKSGIGSQRWVSVLDFDNYTGKHFNLFISSTGKLCKLKCGTTAKEYGKISTGSYSPVPGVATSLGNTYIIAGQNGTVKVNNSYHDILDPNYWEQYSTPDTFQYLDIYSSYIYGFGKNTKRWYRSKNGATWEIASDPVELDTVYDICDWGGNAYIMVGSGQYGNFIHLYNYRSGGIIKRCIVDKPCTFVSCAKANAFEVAVINSTSEDNGYVYLAEPD